MENKNNDNINKGNELDSFFEDLTSLEDSDMGLPEDPELGMPEDLLDSEVKPLSGSVNTEAMGAGLRSMPQPPKNPRSFNFKKWSAVAGILLCLVGLWFLYNTLQNREYAMVDINQQSYSPGTDKQPIVLIKPDFDNTIVDEDESLKTLDGGEYGVQIAVCSLADCVNEYTYKLKQFDFGVKTFNKPVRGEFLEMVSEGTFNREEANEFAKKINQLNNIMGHATSNEVRPGRYRISLGNFNYVEDFKKVKQVIEENIADSRMIMIDDPKRKRVQMVRVVAGGFASMEEAVIARDEIRTLIGVVDSFTVKLNEL